MFAFFSQIKRLTSRDKPAPATINSKANSHGKTSDASSNLSSELSSKKKQNEVELQRKQFLTELAQNIHDEAAVLALLLRCDFADGRLQAAQHIHSHEALLQVRNAMRNHDRRVAKLMQGRLDIMQHAAQMTQQMQACVEQARQLAMQEQILANQLNQLDKQRESLGALPDMPDMLDLVAQYEQARAQVEQKFQAQTLLQRQVLDLLQQLRDTASAISTQDATLHADQFKQFSDSVAQHEAALAVITAHTLRASLPKNLLADCVAALQNCHQQLSVLEKNLAQQKIDIASVIIPAVTENLAANMQTGSDTAPSQHDENEDILASSAATVATAEDITAPLMPLMSVNQAMSRAEIDTALHAFEDALEQGSVQNAKKHDRQLREVDASASSLRPQQRERLLRLRAELNHLLAWAKWGGNVSRDELIKAVEDIATENLAASQLAKKITTLRERWKEMERLSGAASQELWARFDAACNLAYAPAALYFQQQADERKANLGLAEQFLSAMQEQAATLLQMEANWKAYAQFCQNQLAEWKKIGHVDRKHRARLDTAFETHFQSIWQPLQARRAEEMISRQAMVEAVAALDAQQRSAIDSLRQLQERWQKQAAQVPLKRQDEQALWEKFRAACDAVFAQRKQFAVTADTQRQQNLSSKQALCEQLEQALVEFDTAISNAALSDVADVAKVEQYSSTVKEAHKAANLQWKELGAVPKADDAALEQRFQQISANIKNSLSTWQARKKSVQKVQSVKKLQLCWQLENAILSLSKYEQDMQSAPQFEELHQSFTQSWEGLRANGKNNIAQPLEQRFTTGIKVLQLSAQQGLQAQQSQQYLMALQSNQHSFDADLLRLEILCSIDSPAELAKERLHLQIEVLQASLRNGQSEQYKLTVFHDLLRLPAQLDVGRQARFEKIIAQFE
jgi:enamine deaminase RidA (YjgF/YER057c/UK114 family)